MRSTEVRRNGPITQVRPHPHAPAASACGAFKPSDRYGWLHTGGAVLLTACGFILSASGSAAWAAGQALLAVAFVQWFVLLHECGHETLFRRARLNAVVGNVAAFFSIIPFRCWKRVHASHHRWTGWQDMDPTTVSLVPRSLSRFESVVINVSWRFWIPIFSIIYRVTNYWRLTRLKKLYGSGISGAEWRRMLVGAVTLACVYAALLAVVGFGPMARFAGLALLLALSIEDPLLLSQHTYIPQHIRGGGDVRPFSAAEQEAFTRSLKFPRWISKFVLFNFDAHELHHMYPFVPGYRLREIPYTPINEVHWMTWLRTVKSLRGQDFLFENRDVSGIRI